MSPARKVLTCKFGKYTSDGGWCHCPVVETEGGVTVQWLRRRVVSLSSG